MTVAIGAFRSIERNRSRTVNARRGGTQPRHRRSSDLRAPGVIGVVSMGGERKTKRRDAQEPRGMSDAHICRVGASTAGKEDTRSK